MINPIVEYNFLGNFKTYSAKKPYTGICRTFQYDDKKRKVDYTKTWQYGKFVDGSLEYFVQFSFENSSDTTIVFRKFQKDSIFAEEKRFSYDSGKLERISIYYIKGNQRRMKSFGYSKEGFINSESSYFFPMKGDSLNYSGDLVNYKKESVLLDDEFYSIPVRNGDYFEYGGKDGKTITTKGQYTNNYQTGTWTTWYYNGQMKSIGDYSMYNWKNGRWKEWYENGQLKSDIGYLNSNLYGEYEEWYENGNPKEVSNHIAWHVEGEDLQYWPDAKLKKRVVYKNGRTVGKWEEWYSSGQLKSSTTFPNDSTSHAESLNEWYSNGNLRHEKTYSAQGFQFGAEKSYWENGNLQSVYYWDSLGQPIGIAKTYYENGTIQSEESADKHSWFKVGECKYYYPNGKIKSIENISSTGRNGECIFYREDGSEISDLHFKGNAWNGKCVWYFKDGKTWREFYFTDNTRNGPCKEWDENGNLVYNQNFEMGKPVGENSAIVTKKLPANDSIKKIYSQDAIILAAIAINNPESNYYNQLFPPKEMSVRILSELISIYNFIPPEIDSAKLVHFDSLSRTHVYLDYPYYGARKNDTSICGNDGGWPPQLDKYISQMHFKPVFDECYGDDNGGIRRGFIGDVYFNAHAFDSLLKIKNPKYGVEYFGPENFNYYNNNTNTRIECNVTENYSDYYYTLFFSIDPKTHIYYLNYHFRIYPDGSVDLIDYSPSRQEFFYFIPE
jgi:antitoxin component YwqK of YwqJK toxin-antitoxin module